MTGLKELPLSLREVTFPYFYRKMKDAENTSYIQRIIACFKNP